MSDRELLDSFDQLFLGSNKRTLQLARLGANRGGVIVAETPTPVANEVYISLGANGEQGASTATDPLGIDRTAIGQQLWVRRELNKWVIYRAEVLAAGGGGGGGATTLNALTDVDTAGKADGDLLKWNSATGQWIPWSSSGSAGTPHPLSDVGVGALHTGDLHDDQAPQFLMRDGSRPLVGDLDVATGVSIDGVDLDQHEADPDAHHDHATAGNTGITVSASPTQLISLNLEDTAPGLQIDTGAAGGVRVKNFNGIERTASGIGILIKSGVTALKVDGTGLYLDDALAGTGLSINSTTKVLTVNPGEGLKLDVPNDQVEVDKAHPFIWTGTHQYNALTTFNNNIHFMGGDRIITATNTLTLNPTTDLWLDPGGIIVMPTVQTYRSFLFNDFVTGIEGFLNEHTTSNRRYLRINKIKADELHVRVFTADEQRVSRGAEFWARSFGLVEEGLPGEDFFTVPAIGATVDVWFEEAPDLGNFALFIPNNWLQFRTLDQTTGLITQNIWFQIVDGDAAGTNNYVARENQTAPTVQPSHVARQKWRLIRRGGGITGMPVRKGNVGVEFGLPLDYVGSLYTGQFKGQGVVHLSALDEDDGPFVQIQIFETASGGLPSFSNRVRMGNLRNTLDYTTDVFGFAAGVNLAAVPAGDYSTFRGIVAEATNGVRLFNTDIHLYNGSTRVLGVTRNDGLILAHDVDGLTDARRHIAWYDNLNVLGSVPRTVLGSYVYDNSGVTTRQLEMFVTTQSATGASIVAIRAVEPSASRDAGLTLRSRSELSTGATGSLIELFANEVQIRQRLLVGGESDEMDSIATLHVSELSTAVNQTAGFLIEQKTTGGVGDAVMHWRLTSPNRFYSMGIDNSDGDKLKISASTSLGTSDFFVYDPATGLVTVSGLTGGSGGGGGTYTAAPGGGIVITGTEIAVDSTVVRTNVDVIAGAGLVGGGGLAGDITLTVNPGSGLKLSSGVPGAPLLIDLHATAPGLNITSGLQLDATVAGDGLEWVGLTRVMQASLGNGLVFTGTNPARDITIKLRTLSPGSGLGVTTDGLFIQRRNSSHIDSGIMMGTVDGIYLADTVAGDGLEWTTSSERIMQVSLGVGLIFTGTTPARDVRIHLASLGSGMLVDSTGLRLNPLVAGSGLEYIYLTGTGVLRILPGPGITVGGNDVAIDLGTNPGLSTSSGLYVLLPATGSGLVRDSTGLHLNSTVAGDGLIYDTATGEINVVPLNASLIVRASDMYVNLAHNWLWTGDHTFGSAGLFQVNSVAQFNNNINFVSARTINSSGNLTVNPTGNLTFTPTGELVLNPAGTVTLFTAKTFATSSHTDTPTAITGMWVYDRGANEYHMNITSLKMDELHTRVFVADEVRVDRGEEYWSKSFGIVEEEFTLPNVGTTRDVWFENSPALSEIAPNLFSVGDWLLMRTVDTATGMLIRKIWFTVISLVTAGTAANKRQCWRLEKMTGGAGTTGRVRKGTFMLDAGQVGQGWVHLLAYKEMGGPYIQVGDFDSVSGGTTPVFTNRVRMGNLNGVAGITGTFWGFAAGNDLSESPLSGNFSGFTVGKGIGSPGTNYDGLRLYNTDINMYSGGNKIISLNAGTGLSIELSDNITPSIERTIAWVTDVDAPNITTARHSVIQSYRDSAVALNNIFKLKSFSPASDAELILEADGLSGQSTLILLNDTITSTASNFSISSSGAVVAASSIRSNLLLYAPALRAISSAGLRLEDDGGNLGVFIADGGAVGIGRTPVAGIQLHVNGSTMTPTVQGTTTNNGNIVIEGTSSAVKTTSYVLLQPTGGFVGIGIDTPIVQLHVAVDSASSGAALMAQTNGGGAAVASSLILYTSNGTQAVPTATLSGDLIGQVAFQGWDTARSTGASIRAYASANWGTAADVSDDPTNLTFWTVPDGESVQEERFTILSNGNIGVNQPAPAFKLDVAGTLNATGAVTFGSSLAMTGAITGVTALTAAAITATTSLTTNNINARTSAGLSISDLGGNLAIFVENGGFVGINSADPINRFEVIETTLNAGVANFVMNASDPVTIRGITFRNDDRTANSVHGFRFDFVNDSGAITRGGALAFGKEGLFTTGTGLVSYDGYLSLSVALNGVLTERLHITSSGRVGINTADPGAETGGTAETYSRLTVSASDGVANQITLDNTGTGQAALVLKRSGGTVSRWSMYIAASPSTSLQFYHPTPGNAMTLTTAGQLQVSSLVTTGLVDAGGAITGTSIASAGAITGVTLTTPNLYGSSAANGDLTIEGTSSGTKTSSYVILQPTGGYVGVGDNAPLGRFTISDPVSTASVNHLLINSLGANGNTNIPRILMRRANNSGGIMSGEDVGSVGGGGRYDSTAYTGAKAAIRFIATQNWTDVNQGCKISFLVSGDSGATSLTGAFEIGQDGALISTGTYNKALAAGGNNIKPVQIDNNGNIGTFNLYNYTTGTPREAVWVDDAGHLGKETSSIRYKTNVMDVDGDIMDNLIASLRSVSYTEIQDPNKTIRYGFIAEEVDQIEGAKPLVHYDSEGIPSGIPYDKIIVPLIVAVQRLTKRVQFLENEKRRLM